MSSITAAAASAAPLDQTAFDWPSPPASTDSTLWALSSPSERAALVAQVPNPQPGPAPTTRAQVNGLPLGSLPTASIDGFWLGESGNGVRRAYDPGQTPLGQVPAIRPDGGAARVGGSVIFVNGLNNNEAQAANAGQLIANKTGSDVRVFFNATQGANDIPRAVGDNLNTLGVSRTPAANALASTIATSAAGGQNLHIISTSHGSILARNSLIIAREQLLAQFGYRYIALPGLRAELDPAGYQRQLNVNASAENRTYQALNHIKFETIGSGTATFPVAGPKYVHWVNTNDPVVWASGIDFQGVAPRLEASRPAATRWWCALPLANRARSPAITSRPICPRATLPAISTRSTTLIRPAMAALASWMSGGSGSTTEAKPADRSRLGFRHRAFALPCWIADPA